MAERELSPTSYIVLGLLGREPGTPYDLKARIAGSLGNFWTVQHAQVYTEPARLAEEGLLSEHREDSGRRRKTYSITAAGRRALEEWLADPAVGLTELRDPALLKVFFGADPAMIAVGQLAEHRAKLAEFEELQGALKDADLPPGVLLTLEAGIVHMREMVTFCRSWPDPGVSLLAVAFSLRAAGRAQRLTAGGGLAVLPGQLEDQAVGRSA